jgi:mono/diheme cytochrome c family protein
MKNILLALTCMSLLALAGCSGSKPPPIPTVVLDVVPAPFAGRTNPLGADAAAAGADVFSASCESCHGPQGHGDGPAAGYLDPHPKNLAELQAQAADDYLFWRISTGRDGTAMIGWDGILTEEQIWQVIAFIRTLN